MGVEGISLDSAGAIRSDSGHHHTLIDAGDSLTAGTFIPVDNKHLHFGNTQTSAKLTLASGRHKIMLQYADDRSYSGKPVPPEAGLL